MKAERDTFDDSVEEVRELIASADLEQDAEGIEQRSAALLQNRRQLISLALAVLLMVVAIYVVFPKLVGVSDAIARIGVPSSGTSASGARLGWLGDGGANCCMTARCISL